MKINTLITRAVITLFCFVFLAFSYDDYYTPVINKFGQVGLFHTHSAKTLGMGRLSVGAYGNVSRDKKYVVSVTDPNDASWNNGFDPSLTLGNLNYYLGYGITRYLDFSVMVPMYVDFISKREVGGSSWGGKTNGGIGDIELSLKWQYPPYPHRKFFEMAYFGALSLPTGDRSSNGLFNKSYFPRHVYYMKKADNSSDSIEVIDFFTSRGVEFDMKMLWTFDFYQLRGGAPVEFHISYGVRWTPYNLDHLFLLNSGLSIHPANWITFFTEFSGETRISNVDRGFKIGDDPLRLSPGITLTPPGGFYITLGSDISVASQKSHIKYKVSDNNASNSSQYKIVETLIEPRWRFAANIGWGGFVLPQDKDRDGFKDKVDRCPKDPEDFDGFQDNDGCPEFDNDNDGVPDSLDKCANEAEDMDQFEDEDGCPDFDNDKDGIRDQDDKCPNVAEDLDGFQDDDGCIDIDNDVDGIVDSLDRCPDKAEDKDGYEDEDGCPDIDNDMDGIVDSVDKCPDKPETFNAYQDEDGCPDEKPVEKPKAKEIKRGKIILRGVNFETGKAILTPESYAILDQVYESLVEYPEVRIEIIGHTDSVGSRLYNKRLSYKRALAVRDYLISKGISPDRLVAIGMGEDEPIADNTTAEGRAMNRRVELHRID